MTGYLVNSFTPGLTVFDWISGWTGYLVASFTPGLTDGCPAE
jgi:hypothetical protein